MRTNEKRTLATIIDILTLDPREHGHRVAAVIFNEWTIHSRFHSRQSGESREKSGWTKAAIVIKSAILEYTSVNSIWSVLAIVGTVDALSERR